MLRRMRYGSQIGEEKVLNWLIEEFEELIPDFEPYGEDSQLVLFAYKDLQTLMKLKHSFGRIFRRRDELTHLAESNPNELRAFIKVWVSQWLRKWRERVVLFDIKRGKPKSERKLFEAKGIYRNLKCRRDLLQLVMRKLIENGEVCMVKLISENLIVEEIYKYLSERRKKGLPIFEPDPLKIYYKVSKRVKELMRIKEPLVYLDVKYFTSNYP